MRTWALMLGSLVLLAACGEEPASAPEAEPPAATEAETAPPPEPAPTGRPAPPVEELSEAELEAACFRGRQEACDLLGH